MTLKLLIASTLKQQLGSRRFYRLGERSNSWRVYVSTDEFALLKLFPGPRRIGEVLAQSQLGELESLIGLARLVADGYLVESDVASAAPRGEPTARLRRSKRRARFEEQHSPASDAPLTISQRPEPNHTRGAARWLLATLAAAALIPAAFWLGETFGNLRAAWRMPAAAAQAPVPLDVEESFVLSTTVEPVTASIWLDHHPVATGHLNIVLPKDGRIHELRVSEEGFVPTTFVFADMPAPRELHLQALPEALAEGAAPPAAAPEP